MTSRKELISSKEYWMVQLQTSLFAEVQKYLSDNNLTQSDFAKQLNVSKGYISQILNGDFDHKISKLIELSLAIDKAPIVHFENLEAHYTRTKKKTKQKKMDFNVLK
jgi:transcriptional regulator with XRE-family HTH domain